MIGVIIQTAENSGKFSQLLYHKIAAKSIIEHTIDNASMASQGHKLLVLAPLKERRRMEDILYRKVPNSKLILSRFHEEKEFVLDGIFKCSQENGFDHIVLIQGNRPLIQPWIINNCIHEYMRKNINNYYVNAVHEHDSFRVEIFPYWLIAHLFSNLDNEQRIEFRSQIKTQYISEEDTWIQTSLDLNWKNLEQNDLFEHLINGSKEYDIEDMLKEVSDGNKQKAIEE